MRRASKLFSSSSSLAFVAVFLASCAVGPDFKTPTSPDVSAYDFAPTSASTADGAQKLHLGQDIPAQWWGLFHSDDLDRLVTQAIRDNPDLATADASLRVAQDNLAAGETGFFPVVSASFSSTRQKTSAASNDGFFPGFVYTLHNASVNVSYGLDIFGGTRRAVEELHAAADEAKFEREAAYLTLTGNVVTAAIQEASLREQITATRAIIGDQERTLKLLTARFDAGAISKTSVAEQRTTVANARSLLPPLDHQLVVERHALSALLGQMPQNEPSATFKLEKLKLPSDIPLSIPSKLVEQRPDIREAEEYLHAESAAIGVAVSNRLPQVALTADAGSMANTFSRLFAPGGGFWAIGGSAAETIFDAGELADKEDAARDAYLEAQAQYRKTVLTAFQNVADTLHALQSDAESLNAKAEAEKAAADSLSLAETQLKAGAISPIELLTAEQEEQQALLSLIQARAQRYADTAALFTALGGGWWNRDSNGLVVSSDVLVPTNLLKGAP